MFVGQTILPAGLSVAAKTDPWQFLLRLNQILTADTSPIAMMHGVLDALREVNEIEAAWIGKSDGNGHVTPIAAFGEIAKDRADIIGLANIIHGQHRGGPSGRTFRSGQPEIVDDWRNDPSVAIWQPATAHLNYRAAATVPLRGLAGHHSLLVMYSNVHSFFSSVWSLDLLAHLAALIGNALENREKHAALQHAQRLYQTLFNGADQLLSVSSEGRLLRKLCETLVASGLFVAAGVLIAGADGHLRHIASAALRNAHVLRGTSFPPAKGQSQRPLTLDAWEAGKTLVENDYFNNPRFTPTFPLARKIGFNSIAALIIRRGGAPWAVMTVSAAETYYFDNELIKLLERMAALVGHALDELDLKAALRRKREAQHQVARQERLAQLSNLGFQTRQSADNAPGHEQLRSRRLLRKGAVEVHFQPVLNLDDEKIIAVEALARLRDGGDLSQPRKFLPDLTLDDRCLLFRQVLDASLAQLLELDKSGSILNVSVNVDAQVLLLEKTLPYLKKILDQTGLAPSRLVLEILETHDFLDLKRAAGQIEAVRALGVRTALDDLGAGYSSILKIRELPFDVVKLDRAFVAGLREQPDDLIFISVIQTLTSAMGIKLIVEGAEDEAVLDALRMVGVRHVQGYVVAKPMHGSALASWLRNYRPRQASKTPETLLGAYALHTNWIRAFEFLRLHHPVLNQVNRNNPFSLDGYFAGPGARHRTAREAYQALETLLRTDSVSRPKIQDAANNFRLELVTALKTAS